MSEHEFDHSNARCPHLHEWRVALRIKRFLCMNLDGSIEDTGFALLVKCHCGANGVVMDPSPAEMRRATKPYRWFAFHRIRMLAPRETE